MTKLGIKPSYIESEITKKDEDDIIHGWDAALHDKGKLVSPDETAAEIRENCTTSVLACL